MGVREQLGPRQQVGGAWSTGIAHTPARPNLGVRATVQDDLREEKTSWCLLGSFLFAHCLMERERERGLGSGSDPAPHGCCVTLWRVTKLPGPQWLNSQLLMVP